MKSLRLLILALLLPTFVLVSCDQNSGTPDDPVGENTQIELPNKSEQTQQAFADEDTSGGFTFTAKSAWTASVVETSATRASNVSWLRLLSNGKETYSGEAGTFTLAVELDPNYTGETRSATITISCGGTEITINVTQNGKKEDGSAPKFIELSMSDYGAIKPQSTVDFTAGETRTITATVLPKDDAENTIEWQTSDPEIAGISPSGSSCVITAGNIGDAVITITCVEHPEIQTEFTVNVGRTPVATSPSGYVKAINGVDLIFDKDWKVIGKSKMLYGDYYTFEGSVLGSNGSGGLLKRSVGKGDYVDTWEYIYTYDGDCLTQVDYQIVDGQQKYSHIFNTWEDGNLIKIHNARSDTDNQYIVLEYSEYDHTQGNLDINIYLLDWGNEMFAKPFYFGMFDNNLGKHSKQLISKAIYSSESEPSVAELNYERSFRYEFYEGRVTAVYYTDKTVNDNAPQPERKLCDLYY
jgi:hypothetical protein